MNRALEEASGDYLGDRVAAIMEKLGSTQKGTPPASAGVEVKPARHVSAEKSKAKK
jgi:hypothetical protein